MAEGRDDAGERKLGLHAAVEAATAAARDAAPAPIGEQMPLLPLSVKGALDEAENSVPTSRGAGGGRPGRPPGARNKRTQEWVDYLLSRYRSPLIALAELYSRPVQELAGELGLKHPNFDQLVELLRLQVFAAKELAPYLHQKQPMAVQVDQRGVVQLVLEGGPAPAMPAPGGEGVVLEAKIVDPEGESDAMENQ